MTAAEHALIGDAATALAVASQDRHYSVHGSRRSWSECSRDRCPGDRRLVEGLRNLIRASSPADTDWRAIAEGMQQT